MQELCEGDLYAFLDTVRLVLYDQAGGAPHIECMAPLLTDICAGMLYLHSRNIVHGGMHDRPGSRYQGPGPDPYLEGQVQIQVLGGRPGSRSWGAGPDPGPEG